MIDFDLQSAFNDAWHKEVDLRFKESGVPPAEWRSAGRKSKEWPDKENDEFWKAMGPGMAQSYIDWRNESEWRIWEPQEGMPAIELGMRVPIGGVTVKAVVDRVFITPSGELVIVDLKTGSRTPDSDLQLGFYACAIEVAFGVRPKWGGYYKNRDGKLLPLIDLDHYSLELLAYWLRDYARAREQGIYLPNLGGHCNTCGVAFACAAKNGIEAPKFDPSHPAYGRNVE